MALSLVLQFPAEETVTSLTTVPPVSPASDARPELKRTARITGAFYLGLAVTGLLGMLLVRNQIFVEGNPGGTLTNLTVRASLARLGVMLEMGMAVTQALAAVWFYRLFRSIDSFAAGSLAAFGLVNAVMILCSAALLATALDVAGDAALAPARDASTTVQLLYVVSGNIWVVASTFFGLWLIPMGWLVLRSGWQPRLLGWILMVGGAGYVLRAFIPYLFPAAAAVAELFTLPATVGELWIVGYLLVFGVRGRP